MAVLSLDKNMVFWDIVFEDSTGWNSFMGHEIADMSITYEVNQPTTAKINVLSDGYVEDMFVVGRRVQIGMGFDPLDLVPMFTGIVMKEPTGNAGDVLSYTIEAVGREILMGLEEKNRVFAFPASKGAIIAEIAAVNGFTPNIWVDDISILPKDKTPIQKGKTDLEFLQECAARWECGFWITPTFAGPPILNFYDKTMMPYIGDTMKSLHMADLAPTYILGYRSNMAINNVAKIAWKFNTRRSGSPGVSSLSEWGDKEQPEDFVFSYLGERYELTPKAKDAATKNPRLWREYLKVTYVTGPMQDVYVRKYFRKAEGGSRTNQDSYGNEAVEITVDLNIGDPYLRPPRSCQLFYGSDLDGSGGNDRAVSTKLPNFIYNGKFPWETFFKITKVETQLNAGKISTKLTISRRIDGQA